MKRELTCIICPIGCQLTVEKTDDEIKVSGNTCPRGEKYAKDIAPLPIKTGDVIIKDVFGTDIIATTEKLI